MFDVLLFCFILFVGLQVGLSSVKIGKNLYGQNFFQTVYEEARNIQHPVENKKFTNAVTDIGENNASIEKLNPPIQSTELNEIVSINFEKDSIVKEHTFQIPPYNVTGSTEICAGPFRVPCPPTSTCSIVGYRAEVSEKVHHLILLGILNLDYEDFGDHEIKTFARRGCFEYYQVDFAFAWADHGGKDKKYDFDMPPGFAYKTRKKNGDGFASLFLMSVHYSGSPQGLDSNSGVIVKYIEKSNYKLQQAHTFVLVATNIAIPPRQKSYDICNDHLISQYRTSLIVFSHRIHQHTSGVEIYTNIFRDGMFVGILGKESAKNPQIFRNFPLRTIRAGDVLQLHCIFNTEHKDYTTMMGLDKIREEMCNHYIMFAFVENQNLNQNDLDFSWLSKINGRKCSSKVDMDVFHHEKNWSLEASIGSPTAVAIDSNNYLWLFHRGEFEWSGVNRLNPTKIKANTILKIDPNTGKVVKSFGSDMFLIPHGLYIDQEDYIWVTDVGLHQVVKLDQDGNIIKSLGNGNPGNTSFQFNKPTDVVCDSLGNIYVSDGYGNSRIIVFDSEGNYLRQWGRPGKNKNSFRVPHSITIDEFDILYVADRENHRIQVFDINGTNLQIWTSWSTKKKKSYFPEWKQHMSAVHYNRHLGVLYVLDGDEIFVIDQKGNLLQNSFGSNIASWPHDVCSIRTEKEDKTVTHSMFVVQLEGKTLHKYSHTS